MKPWERDWVAEAPAPPSDFAVPWERRWVTGDAGMARIKRIAAEVGGNDEEFVNFATRIAGIESSHGKNTLGPEIKRGMHQGDRARGAWQIMPKTFAGMGGKNIDDPDEVDRLGAKYLYDNWQRFGRDERKAAQAHIAGPGSVRRDGVIPAGSDGQTSIRDYVLKAVPMQGQKPAGPWTINWKK